MRAFALLAAIAVTSCHAAPPPTASGAPTTSTTMAAAATPPGAGELAITYVANEGVLLESEGVRVLIDALVRPNELEYAVLPDAVETRIRERAPEATMFRRMLEDRLRL